MPILRTWSRIFGVVAKHKRIGHTKMRFSEPNDSFALAFHTVDLVNTYMK